MLKILIMVCSMALDHAACNPHSATSIYNANTMPGMSSPSGCMMAAQSIVAGSPTGGIQNYDPKHEYIKIACVREDSTVQRSSREALVRGGQ